MDQVSLHPRRCLKCAYVLTGLASPGKCPECGRGFDLSDPSTYTTRRPIVWWALWGPGLALATVGGLISTAILAFALKNWGQALWLGVPLSAGCLAGYRFRAARVATAFAILAVLLCLILTFGAMNLAGVYCGMVLSAIFAIPVFVGVLLGFALRAELRRRGANQSHYLPIVIFLLLPPTWALFEGPNPKLAVERVTTVETVAATPQECWDSVLFYEDVTHEPPLILRVGLARPLFTKGSAQHVGDIKVCVYNKGHITKQVTRIEPGRLLEFAVIEQDIGYERDVRLLGGSFLIEPAPEGARISLTTEYEPFLAPRFCWRPGERLAVHILHSHVLEGMKLKAQAASKHAAAGAK